MELIKLVNCHKTYVLLYANLLYFYQVPAGSGGRSCTKRCEPLNSQGRVCLHSGHFWWWKDDFAKHHWYDRQANEGGRICVRSAD